MEVKVAYIILKKNKKFHPYKPILLQDLKEDNYE